MSDTPKELLANIPPFGLRMQPDLKEKVRVSAERANRSMNAEIVARLETSFDDTTAVAELEAALSDCFKRLREAEATVKYLEELRVVQEERLQKAEEDGDFSYMTIPENRSLYVILDAQGWPISWQEIVLHMGEIGRAANLQIDSIEARVFDAKLVSNNLREKRFFELYKRYREARGNDVDDAEEDE